MWYMAHKGEGGKVLVVFLPVNINRIILYRVIKNNMIHTNKFM
jgi:hypothetical protein